MMLKWNLKALWIGIIALLILTSGSLARAGVWVCTVDKLSYRNKNKQLQYNEQDLAFLYLGVPYYHEGRILSVFVKDRFDTLTVKMFTSVGLSYYNYTNLMSNYKSPGAIKVPIVTFKQEDELVYYMREKAPAVGYVERYYGYYDYYGLFMCGP